MREATIAAPLLIDFVGYLTRRGLDAATVCRAARLDPAWLEAPNSRVPASAMARLWAAGEALTGDPDLGLHSAEHYNPGALSIVGYVILSCADVAQALDRLCRYAPLLNEGLEVRVVQQGAFTHCRFGPAEGVDSFLRTEPRQVMETLAAGMVLTLARLAAKPPHPSAVSFKHAAPASSLAEHRRLLGVEARFGQPQDEVVYPSAALQVPLLSADPALLAMFEDDARRRLADLRSHGAVSGRIQPLLAARLRGEVPTLASIAADLGMSERSVQRSLGQEATSYRQLVDEVRKGLALSYLSRPGASSTDVAFLLGFSEPSAFTRAFKRWTGSAPSQYRVA